MNLLKYEFDKINWENVVRAILEEVDYDIFKEYFIYETRNNVELEILIDLARDAAYED